MIHMLQAVREMALLRYMKPVHSLPDPRGLLSPAVPSRLVAIAEASKAVQEEVSQQVAKLSLLALRNHQVHLSTRRS